MAYFVAQMGNLNFLQNVKRVNNSCGYWIIIFIQRYSESTLLWGKQQFFFLISICLLCMVYRHLKFLIFFKYGQKIGYNVGFWPLCPLFCQLMALNVVLKALKEHYGLFLSIRTCICLIYLLIKSNWIKTTETIKNKEN